MLTDLTFLQQGKKWPPPCELERLKDYEANRRLFENEHSEVYKEQAKRIERVIGNFDRVISFPVIFNYQRLMSLKIADLIFGEPPSITVADTNKRGETVDDTRQRLIDRVLLETGLLGSAYMAALDVSRYGDGLLIVSNPKGVPVVDVTTPAIWFPVVDKSNIKHSVYQVLAYRYLADEQRKEYH
ncbi:MAG: phage portal protein, partial [Acetanaerobacterium sp.]